MYTVYVQAGYIDEKNRLQNRGVYYNRNINTYIGVTNYRMLTYHRLCFYFRTTNLKRHGVENVWQWEAWRGWKAVLKLLKLLVSVCTR